jgi:hypothetical protein
MRLPDTLFTGQGGNNLLSLITGGGTDGATGHMEY